MTTYATDEDLRIASPLADAALAAINRARVATSQVVTTLEAYREATQTEILRRLRNRGITAEQITREDDLLPVEVAGTLSRLYEAAAQRTSSTQQPGAPDLYAQQAAHWRARYVEELAACAPVDDVRSTGATVEWGRG